jgi:hypothetical protein
VAASTIHPLNPLPDPMLKDSERSGYLSLDEEIREQLSKKSLWSHFLRDNSPTTYELFYNKGNLDLLRKSGDSNQ